MEAAHHPWPALGALLLRDGLVDKNELESVLSMQEDSGHHRISARRLGELLVQRGTVTHAQVAQLVAEQYELPYLELAQSDVNLRAASLLSEELARKYSALPISVLPDGSLLVAVSDPPLVLFSDEFRRLLGVPLRYAVTAQDELDAAIAHAGARSGESTVTGNGVTAGVNVVTQAEDEADLVRSSTVESTFVVPEHPRAHRSAAIGALLVRDGLVSEDELDAALAQQRIAGNKRLGEILVDRGAVTRSQVARLVAEQYDLPFVEVDLSRVQLEASRLLPEGMAHRLSALPVGFGSDGSLLVAVSDPTNVVYADELRLALDAPIRFAVATPDEIDEAISYVHVHPLELPSEDEPALEREAGAEDARPEVGLDDAVDAAGDVPADDEHLAEVVALPTEAAWHDEEPYFEFAEPPADEVGLDDALLMEVTDFPVDEVVEDDTSSASAEVEPEQEPLEEVDDVVLVPSDEIALDDLAVDDADERVSMTLVAVDEGTSTAEVTEDDAETATAEVDVDHAAVVVDDVIRRALSLGASTIQFSPQPAGLVARCRVDRSMRELSTAPGSLAHDAAERLAERAGLDPSLRAPAHGLLAFADEGRALELRVTSVPTRLGLQVTLRVPAADGPPASISELGLRSGAEAALREALRAPSGAVVVCGHSLSGRTTTLYAALQELVGPERAVATIEHPVERLASGLDQVEVDAAAGTTFAQGVRTLLRSDADVVLVGDVPDEETAQVAFRGARADRLVLSALDAPTTTTAVARLVELGVDPRLLSSTLSCLVAQSLLRRVCPDCRETYYASAEEIAELGRPDDESGRRLLARGRGCESCRGTGYRGWAAVFEVLPLTDDLRDLLADGAAPEEIRAAAVAAGMSTLRDEAVGLCLDGVTTPSEVRLVATA